MLFEILNNQQKKILFNYYNEIKNILIILFELFFQKRSIFVFILIIQIKPLFHN